METLAHQRDVEDEHQHGDAANDLDVERRQVVHEDVARDASQPGDQPQRQRDAVGRQRRDNRHLKAGDDEQQGFPEVGVGEDDKPGPDRDQDQGDEPPGELLETLGKRVFAQFYGSGCGYGGRRHAKNGWFRSVSHNFLSGNGERPPARKMGCRDFPSRASGARAIRLLARRRWGGERRGDM
jgi:hypothetical protein